MPVVHYLRLCLQEALSSDRPLKREISKLGQGLCLAMGSTLRGVWLNTGSVFLFVCLFVCLCSKLSPRHNLKGVELVEE